MCERRQQVTVRFVKIAVVGETRAFERRVAVAGSLATGLWVTFAGTTIGAVLLAVVTLGLGLLLPVGGADVPIVISLLNAFSGITVAASGYERSNTLPIVAGTWSARC